MLRRILLAALCLASLVAVLAQAAEPATPLTLYRGDGAPARAFAALPADGAVVRREPLALEKPAVDALVAGSAADPLSQSRLRLPLFDGEEVIARRTRHRRDGSGSVWEGVLEGKAYSQVTLLLREGRIAGNIRWSFGDYQLRFSDGQQWLQKTQQSRYPRGAEPLDITLPAADAGLARVAGDDGSTIDVLVLYTPAARDAAGGSNGILDLADLAVAETNASYANSGISQRLRLVHVAETDYTEVDFSTDLGNLRVDGDGLMDEAHSLRDEHGADLVALLRNQGEYCGIAYLQAPVQSGFASYGFSVTSYSCATGYYSFGHELGHNMGATHDTRVSTAGSGAYAYSHGYVNTTDRWRTIMGYNNACADEGFNCTRLQYWSNPEIDYNAAAMGVVDAADNRRTLNDSALTVANFRAAVVVAPGELSLSPVAGWSVEARAGELHGQATGYTLENVGDSDLDYSVSLSQGWLASDRSSGTLAPGASVQLSLSLGASAAALAVGDHSATLSVSDDSNGAQLDRTVEVSVLPEPAPGELTVSGDHLSASGSEGGPFSPAGGSFTLGNAGEQALTFAAQSDANWLSLSPSSGSLAAGGEQVITASINAAADALAPGDYSATLTFSDSADPGNGISRSLSLRVDPAVGALSIADATLELLQDEDGDGKHRRFRIGFDPDISRGSASVQAAILFRPNGGSWADFDRSASFTVEGAGTPQSLEWTLESGFDSGDYDFAIELFRDGEAVAAARRDKDDDADLDNVPLERAELDQPLPALRTDPTSLSFTASAGDASAQQSLQLHNDGLGLLSIGTISIEPASAWLSVNALPEEIAPGQRHDIGVAVDWQLAPQTQHSLQLRIESNDPDSPLLVPIALDNRANLPEDNYEPNDSRATAFALDDHAGTWLDAIDGSGWQRDEDWYRIRLADDWQRLTVELVFDIDENVDISLFDDSGEALDSATDGEDSETLTGEYPAGDYFLRLTGNGQSSYNLRWSAVARHQLMVQLRGDGTGAVVSTPAGIDCGSACSARFDEGASIELRASAAAGSVFAGWEEEPCGGTGVCTLQLVDGLGLAARFVPDAELAVTPDAAWLASGPVGGPFAPSEQAYTLANAGGVGLSYFISTDAAWLDLQYDQGDLPAGGNTSIRIALKGSANLLPVGQHAASVTFTQLPDGPAFEREILLDVLPLPGELRVVGDDFAASGRQGGVISPASASYTLRNEGGVALDFSVGEQGDLVDIAPASGRLEPGAERLITVSLSAAVADLAVGSHSSLLRFTDTSNDETVERQVQVTIAEPAGELAVDPTTPFNSAGYPGGPFEPAAASYSLRNDGGSALEFSASLDVDWVQPSATAGVLAAGASQSLQLTLTPAANALAVGVHEGTLTIRDHANGDSLQRSVRLTVAATPGELGVSPASPQSLAGSVGGPFEPASLSYRLSNAGGSALEFSASSDQPWLSLSVVDGSVEAGDNVTISASLSAAADALPVGEHRAELRFSDDDSGAVQLREVVLTVNALGELSVSPAGEVVLSGAAGGPFNPGSTDFDLSNVGGSAIDFSASSDQAWLTLSPGSGRLAVDGAVTVSASLNAAADALPVGEHLAQLTFSDSEGSVLQRSLRLSISELPPAAAPGFDPAGGSFAEAVEVRLQSASAGVGLRYTLDGSEPGATHGTPLINGGTLRLAESATLRAVAFGEGWEASSVASAEFVIDPALDSDGDGMPDLYEREHGLDPHDAGDADADLDGDGRSNLDEFRADTDPQRDDVPPVFAAPPVVTLDASGHYTRVSLPPLRAQDHLDGEVVATAGAIGTEAGALLRPGRHLIGWLAVDAAGNAARVEQLLKLRPRVNLAGDQLVGEGQSVEVRALLNGEAADYPVELPFSVSGTAAAPADHNAVDGLLRIESGGEASLEIDIVEDSLVESRETLRITLGEPVNAVLGANPSQQITIADENLPPLLRLSLSQGGAEVRGIAADGGEVSLRVEIEDPNPGQSHRIDWSHSEAALLSQASSDGDTLRFDPVDMAAGVYAAAVVVSDDGSPVQTTRLQRWLPVAVAVPPAGEAPHLLPGSGEADEGEYLIAGDSGLSLSLGGVALSVGSDDAHLDADELSRYGAGRNADGLNDSRAHVGGSFEVEAGGLGELGGQISLVIPLRAAVPEQATLRLHQLDSGWRDWQAADGESLMGMAGEPGLCAEPGAQAWGELQAGQHCLQVTLRDGGVNDADGETNGSVRFLGGLAAQGSDDSGSDGGGSNSGGGGGGSPLWLLLVAIAVSCWRRWR